MKNLITKKNEAAQKRRLAREDSRIIQSELLAYGLPTLRVPKLSVMVESKDEKPHLAFIEGEGFSTSLVAQRLVARSTLWRPILAQSSIPVAESVALRSKQVQYAKEFAKQHGYPLVARSGLSELGDGRGVVIRQESDLATSMAKAYKEYGTGKTIIQKFYGDTRVLVLASSESVLASLNCSDWKPFQLSQNLEKICVDAVSAIPGLSTALVELTLFVDSSHAELAAVVSDIAVTSGLERFNSVAAPNGSSAVSAFVRFEAEKSGLKLDRYTEHLQADITIRGMSASEEELLSLQSFAEELNITMNIATTRNSDLLHGSVDGSTIDIAMFTEILVERGVSNLKCHLVEVTPIF